VVDQRGLQRHHGPAAGQRGGNLLGQHRRERHRVAPVLARGSTPSPRGQAPGPHGPEPPDGLRPGSFVTGPWPTVLARGSDPPEPPDGLRPGSFVTGPWPIPVGSPARGWPGPPAPVKASPPSG